MTDNHMPGSNDQFWLERRGIDFPFYRDHPVRLTGGQWWFVMLAVAAGYAVLILPPPFLRGTLTNIVPSILYSAIPLAALALVAGRHWTALFRRLRGMDVVWILVFLILNILITLGTGFIIVNFLEHSANPAGDTVAAASGADRALFFVRTAIQLLGEEIFSILPFLALLYWLNSKLNMSRKGAIVLASLGVALMFAVAHIHTYDGHLAQALVGVGVARLVLLLPYIVTKNIWISTGAHVLNDWVIFGLPLLLAGFAE